MEEVLSSGVEKVPEELLHEFSTNIAQSIKDSLEQRVRAPTLRMSNIGKPCERQLYYEINNKEEAEPLRPENYMKFMFGHLVEELALLIVKLAGHDVKGQQDEQEIAGIKGHRDAVISGTLIDVKSASTAAFAKFKEGKLAEDDGFGYIPQIQSYLYAGQKDPLVTDKDRTAFLVVDKTLGHIALDIHAKQDTDWSELFEHKKNMVALPEPPEEKLPVEDMGQSGNKKLGRSCSYCPFKKKCYPELRTFLYSYGPVYLTEVKKEPNVPEILGDGTVKEKEKAEPKDRKKNSQEPVRNEDLPESVWVPTKT